HAGAAGLRRSGVLEGPCSVQRAWSRCAAIEGAEGAPFSYAARSTALIGYSHEIPLHIHGNRGRGALHAARCTLHGLRAGLAALAVRFAQYRARLPGELADPAAGPLLVLGRLRDGQHELAWRGV